MCVIFQNIYSKSLIFNFRKNSSGRSVSCVSERVFWKLNFSFWKEISRKYLLYSKKPQIVVELLLTVPLNTSSGTFKFSETFQKCLLYYYAYYLILYSSTFIFFHLHLLLCRPPPTISHLYSVETAAVNLSFGLHSLISPFQPEIKMIY